MMNQVVNHGDPRSFSALLMPLLLLLCQAARLGDQQQLLQALRQPLNAPCTGGDFSTNGTPLHEAAGHGTSDTAGSTGSNDIWRNESDRHHAIYAMLEPSQAAMLWCSVMAFQLWRF